MYHPMNCHGKLESSDNEFPSKLYLIQLNKRETVTNNSNVAAYRVRSSSSVSLLVNVNSSNVTMTDRQQYCKSVIQSLSKLLTDISMQ